MGYIIVRLAASLNDTEQLLMISSYLVTVLLGKLYLQEAASLLLELEFCSDNMDDTPGDIYVFFIRKGSISSFSLGTINGRFLDRN